MDLRELVQALAGLVALEHPRLARDAGNLAQRWIIESWAEMPRAPGAEFVSEFAVASRVLARVLQDRGLSMEPVAAGEYLRRAWDTFERRARLREGITKEWLAELRRLTAGLGIVTDGDRENVARLMNRLGLVPYFNVVVTSEAVRTYKPNPGIYEAALEALHAEPERSLFVSDMPLDLEGAARLGMTTALLETGLIRDTDDVPPGTLRLRRPSDLTPVLRRFAESGRFEKPA